MARFIVSHGKTFAWMAALGMVQGGISTLSLAPFNWPLIVWVVPWPLFYFAVRFRDSLPALFLAGALAAFFTCLFAFNWMLNMFAEFGGIPFWLGVLVFIPYSVVLNFKVPLFVVLFGVASRPRYRRRLPPSWFVAATLALFCDTVSPQIFPWFWGNLLAKNTVLLQIAEVTGIYGLSFVLFAGSFWLFRVTFFFWRSKSRLARLRRTLFGPIAWRLALLPALLVVLAGFGFWRMHYFIALQAGLPKVRVASIQPNAPLEKYGEDQVTLATLEQLMYVTIPELVREAARAADGRLDLIVLPESAVPYFSTDEGAQTRRWGLYSPEFHLMAQLLGYNWNAEVFLNEVRIDLGRDLSGRPREEAFNSAALFGRDGRRLGQYDKRVLLAFGEYIPGQKFFETTGLDQVFPTLRGGRFFPGRSASALPYSRANTEGAAGPSALPEEQKTRVDLSAKITPTIFLSEFPKGRSFRADGGFLPMICYEIIIPDFPRAFFRANEPGPEFMVNITQDGWYGNGIESFQHYELGRARAVEYRRAIVRATNSGTSGFVDLAGRYAEPLYGPVFTAQGEKGVQVWDVPAYAGPRTLYAVLGNAWMILPFGWLGIFYVWRRGRETARRGQVRGSSGKKKGTGAAGNPPQKGKSKRRGKRR